MEAPEEHVHRQPVLSTPYREPDRHWATVGDTVTNDIVARRRNAHEPIPTKPAEAQQQSFDFDREVSDVGDLDRLRAEVRTWRRDLWPGTTTATRVLLEYWAREPGEGPVYSPFFAQREAIETVVYLTEIARPDHWMVTKLKRIAEDYSQGLTRLALRMATGTGKTMVMACLIAWYAVNNRREHRADSRGLAKNVDRVVVLCPGRTIRDRLAGLSPLASRNIYEDWRLLPSRLAPRLRGFPVNVINWEKLQPRKGVDFARLEGKTGTGWLNRTKTIQVLGANKLFKQPESRVAVWTRLLDFRRTRSIERVVVLNDEGHHCWERCDGEKPGVWMESLHALKSHRRFQLAQVIDLTATPIFINPKKTRSPKGTKLGKAELMPWIVSEFSLLEAMESGLVKIPQPPHSDSQCEESSLRNLFEANKGQKLVDLSGMNLVRQGAEILYDDYQKTYETWDRISDQHIGKPVLIVVANNKMNARAIYEMFGGRRRSDGLLEASEFKLLSNVPRNGADETECSIHTILVLSKTNSPERAENDQVKGGALGLRTVGSGAGHATDKELREVLQTVAQPGEAGEQVRCVISVGMLTEGWDCQRVTHILGYRKFASQLLCEQTMGRALRRRDYENLEDVMRRDNDQIERRYPAEYATVFGVPFDRFGSDYSPQEPKPITRKIEVIPLEGRLIRFHIAVPDFTGYTISSRGHTLSLNTSQAITKLPHWFPRESKKIEWVEIGGAIGLRSTLQPKYKSRPEYGSWLLAADLVQTILSSEQIQLVEGKASTVRTGILFAECLKIVKQWLAIDEIQLSDIDLTVSDIREIAKSAIIDAARLDRRPVEKTGIPRDFRQQHRSAGNWRPFWTGLQNITNVDRSELNVAACHTKLEVRIARALDQSHHVDAFFRNHGPERMEIPYKFEGCWAKYVPDFFVRCKPVEGIVPHVVLEGKGQPDTKSFQKAWWTDNWWVPCANALDGEENHKWIRREINSASEVDSAIASAIREAAVQRNQ